MVGEDEFPVRGRGDGLAGDVVRGGSDAARRQDDLRAAEGLAEGGHHPGEVVPDGRLVVEVQPDRGPGVNGADG